MLRELHLPVLFEGSEGANNHHPLWWFYRTVLSSVSVGVFLLTPFFVTKLCQQLPPNLGSFNSTPAVASSWSWAHGLATLSSCSSAATGVAHGIEGTKEQEFGIWRGNLPPPALECLLETSVVWGRDGFAPAKGPLQIFNPEMCEL